MNTNFYMRPAFHRVKSYIFNKNTYSNSYSPHVAASNNFFKFQESVCKSPVMKDNINGSYNNFNSNLNNNSAYLNN